jgi:hypothetical protein
VALPEILLGLTVVVSAGTAYGASLRRAGFSTAAPFLAVAFGAAGWLLWNETVPLVPQILLLGAVVALALAFLGDF